MSKADLDKLTAQFPGAIIASHSRHGDDTAIIRTADFPAVMTWLRDVAGFDFLVDVTAVDLPVHSGLGDHGRTRRHAMLAATVEKDLA